MLSFNSQESKLTTTSQSAKTQSVTKTSQSAQCSGASQIRGSLAYSRDPKCNMPRYSNSSRPCSQVRASARLSTKMATLTNWDSEKALLMSHHCLQAVSVNWKDWAMLCTWLRISARSCLLAPGERIPLATFNLTRHSVACNVTKSASSIHTCTFGL